MINRRVNCKKCGGRHDYRIACPVRPPKVLKCKKCGWKIKQIDSYNGGTILACINYKCSEQGRSI